MLISRTEIFMRKRLHESRKKKKLSFEDKLDDAFPMISSQVCYSHSVGLGRE